MKFLKLSFTIVSKHINYSEIGLTKDVQDLIPKTIKYS